MPYCANTQIPSTIRWRKPIARIFLSRLLSAGDKARRGAPIDNPGQKADTRRPGNIRGSAAHNGHRAAPTALQAMYIKLTTNVPFAPRSYRSRSAAPAGQTSRHDLDGQALFQLIASAVQVALISSGRRRSPGGVGADRRVCTQRSPGKRGDYTDVYKKGSMSKRHRVQHNVEQEFLEFSDFGPNAATRFPPSIRIKIGVARGANHDTCRMAFHDAAEHALQSP